MTDTLTDEQIAIGGLNGDWNKLHAALSQTVAALEEIRDNAAMKPNGGAWAGGIAMLCLGTLKVRP